MKKTIRSLICGAALLAAVSPGGLIVAADTGTTTVSTSTTTVTPAAGGDGIGIGIVIPDTGQGLTPILLGGVDRIRVSEGEFSIALVSLFCPAGRPTGDVTGAVIGGQGSLGWLDGTGEHVYSTDVVLKPDTVVGEHEITTRCGTADVRGVFTVTGVPVPKSLADQIRERLDGDGDDGGDDDGDGGDDQVRIKPRGGAETGFGPGA